MQIDTGDQPNAVEPVDPAGARGARTVVQTGDGVQLPLEPGRQVVARVVQVDRQAGTAKLSLAGETIDVQSDASLSPGQTVALDVGRSNTGAITLQIADTAAQQTAQVAQNAAQAATETAEVSVQSQYQSQLEQGGIASTSGSNLAQYAPGAVQALAREGVQAAPAVVRTVTQAIAQIVAQVEGDQTGSAVAAGAGSAGAQTAGEDGAGSQLAGNAAQAFATLAARGIPLDPSAAARVGAALDVAGNLGGRLAALAQAAPEIAAALPEGPPDAQALRMAAGGQLDPTEFGVARIVQASEAPTSSALNQGATAQALSQTTETQTVQQDQPGRAAVRQVTTNQPVEVPNEIAQSTHSAAGAQPAVLRVIPGLAATSGNAPLTAGGRDAMLRPLGFVEPFAEPDDTAAAGDEAPQAQAAQVDAQAQDGQQPTAESAAGPAQAQTTPQVAQVVANLSNVLAHFAAAVEPTDAGVNPGAIGPGHDAVANVAQQGAGTYTPEAAGGTASGAPAPLVVALREAFADDGAGSGPGSDLANTLANYSPSQVASALQQLPEQQTLQLAGRLLASLPPGAGAGDDAASASLRSAVQGALHDLGTALQGTAGQASDAALLRSALASVASHDTRPGVADEASRLLAATDGAQLLSTPKTGADPGYIYFQLPMPGQQSAEVLVRRDAGRRSVSFDQFDIAFLLNTSSLGSLMVHVQAHPAGVHATVLTDQPRMEGFLAEQVDSLREPLEREARRPTLVDVGVFASGSAPASLLDFAHSDAAPGETTLYA